MRSEAIPLYCTICKEPIPESRLLLKATTCSKEHARQAKNARRRRRDEDKCRYCNRPSSQEERTLFAAWRRTIDPPKKRGPKPKSTEARVTSSEE